MSAAHSDVDPSTKKGDQSSSCENILEQLMRSRNSASSLAAMPGWRALREELRQQEGRAQNDLSDIFIPPGCCRGALGGRGAAGGA